MLVCPVVAYWAVTGVYELLDLSHHRAVVRRRVARAQPGRANTMTRTHVFLRVLLQQAIQTALAIVALLLDPQQCDANRPVAGLLHNGVQFVVAMFVMDAWQYWIHRAMHVNTFLYKHIHSTHHRLVMPYAMGALYNHPAEALLLDTLGAGVSMYAAGLSCRLATVFFTVSTMKTVFDHSGYRWPLNPIHDLFPNSAAFHDVHHDLRHIKANYSQPFFTHWDVIMGSFVAPAAIHMSQVQIDAALKEKELQQVGKSDSVLAPDAVATVGVRAADKAAASAATVGVGAETATAVAGNVAGNGGVVVTEKQAAEPFANRVASDTLAMSAEMLPVEKPSASPVRAVLLPSVADAAHTPNVTTRSRARQQLATPQKH
jgi:sphinganine C4-monooxygenase